MVNLFYGFLSGDTDLPSQFDGQLLLNKLQTADHLVLGMETNLTDRWTLEVETLRKSASIRSPTSTGTSFTMNIPAYDDEPELLKKDFIVESGMAKGLDFSSNL